MKILLLHILLMQSLVSYAADEKQLGVKFEIGYLFSTAKGTFQDVDINLEMDLNQLDECFVHAVVNTQSIRMRSSAMEKFAKKEDFFDVNRFPTITFRLNKIKRTNNRFDAYGILKIKDVSKAIDIPFTVEKMKNGSRVLCSRFAIDRTKYNVGKSIPGLDDEVVIELQIPF